MAEIKKNSQYTCCKRSIVLKTPQIYGLVNGVIKRFLVVVQAVKRESAFFLTTLLIYRSLRFFSDPNGRFIICDIEADSKSLTLANIYAPNEDDPNFFRAFFDHLSSFHCEEIIIGGDFNLVLDLNKDKKGGLAKTHKNALKVVQNLSESLELSDAWRILNPETTRYTWRQRQPDIHCRLDFFLVSQSSICNITQADIIPGFKTDHSMITLCLSLHSNPRGKGFWKLNTSFLSDA